jgi:hypothetical protein
LVFLVFMRPSTLMPVATHLPTEPTLAVKRSRNRQPCTLMKLREGSCRWPQGDPGTEEFLFCGDEAAKGYPYCETHRGIAYVRSAA